MAFIGDSENTQFSYLEYQLLLMSLASCMCLCLGIIEVVMRRFQMLPLLFPGMFSLRKRRIFFFEFDITDGALGKHIRADAKIIIRTTVCTVMSYLWQHCVLETTQQLGTAFPPQCDVAGTDCFASNLAFVTLFSREHTSIDCSGPRVAFPSNKIISCIHFIRPNASSWLMHIAISHSVTQLTFKFYELCVSIAGRSLRARRFVTFLVLAFPCVFVILFFSGELSSFISSWLSFVMTMSFPLFLFATRRASWSLYALWEEESERMQKSVDEHLKSAFPELEAEDQEHQGKTGRTKSFFSVGTSLLRNLTSRASKSNDDVDNEASTLSTFPRQYLLVEDASPAHGNASATTSKLFTKRLSGCTQLADQESQAVVALAAKKLEALSTSEEVYSTPTSLFRGRKSDRGSSKNSKSQRAKGPDSHNVSVASLAPVVAGSSKRNAGGEGLKHQGYGDLQAPHNDLSPCVLGASLLSV